MEVEAPFEHQSVTVGRAGGRRRAPRRRRPAAASATGGESRIVVRRGRRRAGGGQHRQRPPFLLREVGLDHVLGDRRAEVAVLAVLGEDHAGDLRVVARREEHEPAVVAQVLVGALRARCLPWIEITCAVPVLPATSRPVDARRGRRCRRR